MKLLAILAVSYLIWEIRSSNLVSTKQQAVDLPEEYECIASRNSNKPDTLLGFYDNDTIYITFTGKHR